MQNLGLAFLPWNPVHQAASTVTGELIIPACHAVLSACMCGASWPGVTDTCHQAISGVSGARGG